MTRLPPQVPLHHASKFASKMVVAVTKPSYTHRVQQHNRYAPVAQLDRASGFEPEGRGFESLRARH